MEGIVVKLSARNVLKGTVVRIVPGSINSEVVLKISDDVEIVSIVSKESVSALGLTAGAPAYAVIKASNVILGVD